MDIVRQLQRLKGIDDGDENDSYQNGQLGRRKTIHNLERHRQTRPAIGTLDVAFKKRFFSISAEAAANGTETGKLSSSSVSRVHCNLNATVLLHDSYFQH